MRGLVDQIAKDHLNRVRLKDDFISAACPFHKGGQERHPSFWINRDNGAWGCFTCSTGGSDLRDLLKNLGIQNHSIESRIQDARKEAAGELKVSQLRQKKKARSEFKGTYILPEALLGVFDWTPTALVDKGYPESLLIEHDIGYDNRLDRITFPVRDVEGNLVGVSGRAVIPGTIPKYLFYSGKRTFNGESYNGELGEWCPDYSNDDVRNHLWRGNIVFPRLINGNPKDGYIIIVEGFKACLWMVLCGWENTVAIMGTSMSPSQERLIRRLGVKTFVLTDANQPGRDASKKICQRLAVNTFPVYECDYPVGSEESTQPDNLTAEELTQVFETSKRATGGYYGLGTRNSKRYENNSKPKSWGWKGGV
jgi:DNA primase